MQVTFSTPLSDAAFADAQGIIPGGVNSPVRAFKAVGRTPVFIERGSGAYIYDLDGHQYIDYVGSFGPLILGHAHPAVIDAITTAAAHGTSFGAPTLRETTLAQAIQDAMPSLDLIRFVSSGTEACMSALRLARAYTGRDIIVKIDGGYHGHSDGLLSRAGSGPLTLGAPDSPGVPAPIAAATVTIPFNDVAALESVLQKYSVAAFILEPVPANMGVVLPAPGYLQAARAATERHGTLLIFDEVITGFRVARGGAQAYYGVRPDLTCLGKVIGGGLPVGAYGGRRDIMSLIAPSGSVYQAGTLSGNPLAMSAGIAALNLLAEPGIYERLDALSARLGEGLQRAAVDAGVPVRAPRIGSLQTLFFAGSDVTDYTSARRARTDLYAAFFRSMLTQGIYLAPSQFEAAFVSAAHTTDDVDRTIAAARRALHDTATLSL